MEEILKKQQLRFREAKNFSAQSEAVWEMILICQNRPFHTVRNCEFRYTVRGHEIKISRKEKTITRATVDAALRRALKQETVSGPKQLGFLALPICIRCFFILRSASVFDLSLAQRPLRLVCPSCRIRFCL